MHLREHNVQEKDSAYYLYTPTQKMREALYYPERIGYGHFLAGYRLNRAPMDNFLVAYIAEGSFHFRFADVDAVANAGEFLLVDCYQPHLFSTDVECRDLWLHYDGPCARAMYDYIVDKLGNVIPADSRNLALGGMHAILGMLQEPHRIVEPELSHHIDGILTVLASGTPHDSHSSRNTFDIIEDCLTFIAAHLQDDLSLERLASRAMMSTYYFAKQFKRHTGTSPYQFILRARIERAKFLLHSTDFSITYISADCGFQDPSTFCAAFRRIVGSSPTDYRDAMMLPA